MREGDRGIVKRNSQLREDLVDEQPLLGLLIQPKAGKTIYRCIWH